MERWERKRLCVSGEKATRNFQGDAGLAYQNDDDAIRSFPLATVRCRGGRNRNLGNLRRALSTGIEPPKGRVRTNAEEQCHRFGLATFAEGDLLLRMRFPLRASFPAKTYTFLIGALFAAVTLTAQTPPAPPPINHDFDFWIGEWNVTTPDGQLAGTNRIEEIADGRGLLENWVGTPGPNGQSGGSGKSLNAYNPIKKQWQQFWVGSGGAVLELAGGLDAKGRMVLSGSGRTGSTNRITWTPNTDGTVRQFWEVSRDSGATWQTVFDGLYRKKSEAARR